MKKWKQLVVFVMILTMVMGMTSFAAGTGTDGNSGSATASGDNTTSGNKPTPPTTDGDNNNAGNVVIGTTPAPAVESVKVVVNGKETDARVNIYEIETEEEVELLTAGLKSDTEKLTGFDSAKVTTYLFQLVLSDGDKTVTNLDGSVEVPLDCTDLIPASATKDHVRVLHFANNAWEKRKVVSCEKGIVTAEFDSFSPVAVVYSEEAVPDIEKVTETKDAWKLTSGTQRNKYNVIILNWKQLGGKKDKYELGFFNSPEDVNPYRIVTTSKGIYKFSKAVCGNEYFFKVRVKGSSTWSDACYAYTTLEGKGAPQITSVKTTYNTITIKWKKVTGAKSYDIYDSLSAKTPIATVKGTKVTFKNVKTGTSFQYYVRPVRENSIGDVSVAATGTTELQAVTGVKVKGLDSATVKVTWKKVKGATSYKVERWVEPWSEGEYSEPGRWMQISDSKTPVTSNSFVDPGIFKYTWEDEVETYTNGLTPNKTYKYRITAVRDGSNSKSGEGQGKTKNIPK